VKPPPGRPSDRLPARGVPAWLEPRRDHHQNGRERAQRWPVGDLRCLAFNITSHRATVLTPVPEAVAYERDLLIGFQLSVIPICHAHGFTAAQATDCGLGPRAPGAPTS
jgi:hypothetical protein